MSWVFDNSKPIYAQIEDEIKIMILSGKLQPGDKIQTVRELAGEAGVNPNTMQKALTEVERKKLIITERTSGRFVTTDQQLLNQIRMDYLHDHLLVLLQKLTTLGFTKEEIYQALDRYFQEVNANE